MMLTPEQLDEIRKRCAAETPGPWYANEDAFVIDGTGRYLISVFPDEAFLRDEDEEFCACARADIPALLSHIDALAAERNTLAAQVAELRRALEMAVDVLADVGAGGEILHRGANDNPEQRAIHALNVAEAALDRDPGEAVRRVEALERLWAAYKEADEAWASVESDHSPSHAASVERRDQADARLRQVVQEILAMEGRTS